MYGSSYNKGLLGDRWPEDEQPYEQKQKRAASAEPVDPLKGSCLGVVIRMVLLVVVTVCATIGFITIVRWLLP